jgi:hypothetical protein
VLAFLCNPDSVAGLFGVDINIATSILGSDGAITGFSLGSDFITIEEIAVSEPALISSAEDLSSVQVVG